MSNGTLLAGPYTWNLSSGTNGWRTYSFPAPVSVAPGTYIISITTGPDHYYAQALNVTTFTRSQVRYLEGTVSLSSGYSNSNYFRDIVFATNNCSAQPDLTPGSIGSAQTICYNTSPASLTQLTAPSGGTGSYTYQWQSSPDNSTWTNIAGATLSGYSPSALTVSTYYRRVVSSGSYTPVNSNMVLITVSPQISLAQLHDNITITANTSTNFNVVITGGTSPYTVNYTRNGVAQTAVTNYVSGTNISTGVLAAGAYIYALTSVTDVNGCTAQNLGTSITITVLGNAIGDLRVRSNIIVFNAVQGHSLSTQQSIFIFSASNNSLNWSRSIDVSWLIPDKQSGTTNDVLRVGVNTTGLIQGIYNGNITISSPQSTGDPVIVPVTLIINPDVPVKPTTWKDDFAGAMSVSVDDGQSTAFERLQSHGFQGTYVYIGTVPPSSYTGLYNAGMELGSHLTTHPCGDIGDNVLQYQEIEPNISGICASIPQACNEFITLVWPCGAANFHEENIAAEYFLSARGVDAQQLEDANPVNLMQLKSYYPGYYPGMPDQKTIVDAAISQKKWFITCLHDQLLDDGAIDYAVSKDIWVTSIGRVVKYILQRDRYILTNYSAGVNTISFNASRLAIPSSAFRNFEAAFRAFDVTTLQIDIDDSRIVENVLVDGVINSYQIKSQNGNNVLLTNVRLEPSVNRTVEIRYSSGAKSENSGSSATSSKAGKDVVLLPEENILHQNYPNPFRGNTLIEFDLAEEIQVTIEICNSIGHKIETVLSQKMGPGNHNINWNSKNYAPGYYYLTMKAGIYRRTIKMLLLK
jgi:hypothetical protein